MRATLFDTETTGLIDNHTRKLETQPEVVEIALIMVDWAEPERVYQVMDTLVKPTLGIPKEARCREYGFSEEMLEGMPTFAQIANDVAKFFNVDVVLGQNLSFDMEMLDLEYERLGRKLAWPKVRLCTVEQSAAVFGRRMKLGELHHELLGYEFKDAHRAMPDTKALLDCVREMKRRLWL